MDVARRIEEGDQEDRRLEYKDKRADNRDVALELTALANAQGGAVVVGVQEDDDGRPDLIQDIADVHARGEGVANVIYDEVEPILEFDNNTIEIDGSQVGVFEVERADVLHSFRNQRIEEPVFPVRQSTRKAYLHGREVEEHYREKYQSANQSESSEGLFRLNDEDLPDPANYFIKAPDGHISNICIFSDIHYPEQPTRVTLRANYLEDGLVEHAFAMLDRIFDITLGESSFTINQSNGAWIGRGFENFVANLRHQEERYEQVRQELDYDLELYGNSQAVLISEFGAVYPESVLILYVAPFSDGSGYRHFSINLLLDGSPVDIRPLVEYSEQTGLELSTSKKVSIRSDGIERPSRLPVDVVERTERHNVLGDDGRSSIDGAICTNPFHGRPEVAEREIDLPTPTVLSSYENMRAHLIDWDDPENPSNYECKSFIVTDWNSFTRGIYGDVKHVHYRINW